MSKSRTFFVLNREDESEIILRAILSNDEVYNEIKSIFTLITFSYSSYISKIFTNKLDDELYNLEMQIIVEKSEEKSVLRLIHDANYIKVT